MASPPPWEVSSVPEAMAQKEQDQTPRTSQLHSFKGEARYASMAFSEPLKLRFVSG